MERIFNLLSRADKRQVAQEEKGILSEATRRALKYMLQKDIPITPKSFELWFLVHLYLLLHEANGKEASVDEALNDVLEHLKRKDMDEKLLREMRDRMEEVLDRSYGCIGETIETVKEHNRFLSDHVKQLSQLAQGEDVTAFIAALIEKVEELQDTNSRLEGELRRVRNDLSRLKKSFRKVSVEANRDPLTGLYNRRVLDEVLRRSIKNFEKARENFSVVITDLDDFKRINDVYGHLAGDEVLVTFADILKSDLRMDDVAARYGGEEFVVVLACLDVKGAVKVAGRIRERLESTPVVWGDDIIHVTASFGVAQVREGDTPTTVIERADKALYLAKSDGKNCVRSEKDLELRGVK